MTRAGWIARWLGRLRAAPIDWLTGRAMRKSPNRAALDREHVAKLDAEQPADAELASEPSGREATAAGRKSRNRARHGSTPDAPGAPRDRRR
jgi:hypothetical protein